MENKVDIICRHISALIFKQFGDEWKIMLMNRNEDVSFGEFWASVAGGIEEGEDAIQATLREIYEETQLKPSRFYSGDICEQFYHEGMNAIAIGPVFVAFIDDDQEPILNREHTEYGWFTKDEAMAKLPFPGQKRITREVWTDFIDVPAPDAARLI